MMMVSPLTGAGAGFHFVASLKLPTIGVF